MRGEDESAAAPVPLLVLLPPAGAAAAPLPLLLAQRRCSAKAAPTPKAPAKK